MSWLYRIFISAASFFAPIETWHNQDFGDGQGFLDPRVFHVLGGNSLRL